MNRTFSRHISLASVVPPVLSAAVCLVLLWNRTASGACGALFMMVVAVFLVERLLHTEYVFSGDSLVISRGRFSRRLVISVNEITRVEVISRMFVKYVLLEYGAGHYLSVQPDNTDGFIKEICKRQ